MSFHAQTKEEIKKAMLAKDALKLGVMRAMSAAFTNELVAKGRKPQEELSDEDAMAVVKRMVKQRKDSIEQFEKGGRKDLADTERAELSVLEVYLPKTMSREDIKKVATVKQKELNITDKAKMGMFIGAIAKELKGQADGADIKAVVEEILK